MLPHSLLALPHNALIILVGLLGINFLIGFHELGHFIFCKLFNVRTPSFSIGFGPKLFSKKIGGTEFAFSAIPLGGYVEIAGMAEMGQGAQKDAHARDGESFSQKAYYQKFLILMGGIIFNLIFAYLALIFIFMIGLPRTELIYPRNAIPVVSSILESSTPETSYFKAGDRILALDTEIIGNDVMKIYSYLRSHANQTITVTVQRDGHKLTFPLTLGANLVAESGKLGIVFEIEPFPTHSFIDSIKKGIELTHIYIGATIAGFKHIFSKRDVSQLSGPISIISLTMNGARQGLGIFLLILAIVSINLAILNLLPLPILDGGQLLFYTIEAIIRRPLSIKIREYIHIASWILVLLLLLYTSTNDVYKLIKNNVLFKKISGLFGF